MSKYTIKFNYKASITIEVEGDFRHEGDALDKAREIAEDADIEEFNIGEEMESKILNVE
jgi:hypothetical protein